MVYNTEISFYAIYEMEDTKGITVKEARNNRYKARPFPFLSLCGTRRFDGGGTLSSSEELSESD